MSLSFRRLALHCNQACIEYEKRLRRLLQARSCREGLRQGRLRFSSCSNAIGKGWSMGQRKYPIFLLVLTSIEGPFLFGLRH